MPEEKAEHLIANAEINEPTKLDQNPQPSDEAFSATQSEPESQTVMAQKIKVETGEVSFQPIPQEKITGQVAESPIVSADQGTDIHNLTDMKEGLQPLRDLLRTGHEDPFQLAVEKVTGQPAPTANEVEKEATGYQSPTIPKGNGQK